MSAEQIAALALLFSLFMAGCGAFGWLVGRMDKIARQSAEDRHRLGSQVASLIAESENRLTDRLDRIEDRLDHHHR